MIFTPRFALALAAAAVLIGLSGRVSLFAALGSVLLGSAVAVAAADVILLTRRSRLEVERECEDRLSLGARNPVKLRIANLSPAPLRGRIRDDYPVGTCARGEEQDFTLPARGQTVITYQVVPSNRGDYEFGDIYVRLSGPLGMAVRQIRIPARRCVKVYPNLLEIRRYDALLRRRLPLQPGRRPARTYGRGTDFESLRDYLPDDELRAVDWKATARRGRLTVRQYQQERAQNILILLDCGRLMGSVVSGLTRMDHAVNAAAVLAHAAEVRGDRVGLLAFNSDVRVFLPPRGGRSQTLRLLSLAYHLNEATGDSDYARAFAFLSSRWTRRSLLIVFSDIPDVESIGPLAAQLAGAARRHLCLAAAVSDPEVVAAATTAPTGPDAAYAAAAARQSIEARREAKARIASTGSVVVEAAADGFTAAVVESYLDIKTRALL